MFFNCNQTTWTFQQMFAETLGTSRSFSQSKGMSCFTGTMVGWNWAMRPKVQAMVSPSSQTVIWCNGRLGMIGGMCSELKHSNLLDLSKSWTQKTCFKVFASSKNIHSIIFHQSHALPHWGLEEPWPNDWGFAPPWVASSQTLGPPWWSHKPAPLLHGTSNPGVLVLRPPAESSISEKPNSTI